MNSLNTNHTFKFEFSVFLFISAIVCIQFNHFSFCYSVDFGIHNMLINNVINSGHLGVSYPPFGYYLGSIMSFFFGSTIVAMNTISLLALCVSVWIICILLVKTGIQNAIITGVVLFGFFAFTNDTSFIGHELSRNYFYAQNLENALFLIAILINEKVKNDPAKRFSISLFFVAISYYVFPIQGLILAGFTTVLLFYEVFTIKGKFLLYPFGFFVLSIVLFAINPATYNMITQVGNNNGSLFFWLFSNTPTDLSVWGVAFIFICLAMSTIVFLRELLNKMKGKDNNILMIINTITLSTSFLSFGQWILLIISKSNSYAVKKYFFILGTFAVIEVIYLITSKTRNKKHLPREASVLLLPVLLYSIFLPLQKRDISDVIKYDKEIKAYCKSFDVSEDIPVLAKLPIDPIYNYAINISSLRWSSDTAYELCNISGKHPDTFFGGKLIVSGKGEEKYSKKIGENIFLIDGENYYLWKANYIESGDEPIIESPEKADPLYGLVRYDGVTGYSIDLIDNKPFKELVEHKKADIFSMEGWAIDSVYQRAISKAYLRINNQYFQFKMIERKDVAEYFKNEAYLKSGLSISIYLKNLLVESNMYSLYFISYDKKHYYEIKNKGSISSVE
jgi:hypothetical protein